MLYHKTFVALLRVSAPLLTAGLLGAACSQGGTSPTETTRTLSAAQSGPTTITVLLPNPVLPSAPVITASNSVEVGPLAQIAGTVVAMGALGGGVNVGPEVPIAGDAWSGGGANVGPGVDITGTLHAAVATIDPSATVSVDANPTFNPPDTVTWSVPTPGSSAGDVSVSSGQTTALAPGAYGHVSTKAGGTLSLASGYYFFSSLNVAAGSVLRFTGPTVVYVTDSLVYSGSIQDTVGNASLLLAYLGGGAVDLDSGFTGTLVAPNAAIELTTNTYVGSFFGTDVSVSPEATLNLASFPLPPSVCIGLANGTACATSSNGNGVCQNASCVPVAPVPPSGVASPLPAPPTGGPGCYVGTLNGWAQVPCNDPTTVIDGFQHLDVSHDGLSSESYVVSIPGGQMREPAVPLVYGAVETTIASVDSEADVAGIVSTNNKWSVQNNTNQFPCNGNGAAGSVGCAVQFGVITDGVAGDSAVCVVNADITSCPPGKPCNVTYANTCIGMNGTNVTNPGIDALIDVKTRTGPLQPFDFANVAGFAFTQNGQAQLAVVAQFSWVQNGDTVPATVDFPNRVPGLYAVVTADTYGLAGNWTDVTGGILGEENGSVATFKNAEVLTRIAASSCQGDVSADGPICPLLHPFSSTDVGFQTKSVTVETNNLTLVQQPLPAFPNANLAVTDILASDNVPAGSPTATCLPSQPNHLFIRDNNGDNGGVPSNSGNVPFWDSPDIFVVPQGGPAPGINDVPEDFELAAGQEYVVYLRVHNDYGCNAINGSINVLIDAADPDMGFANWTPVTAGADTGQYISFTPTVQPAVGAFASAILGPFGPFKPSASAHKCLLAAIAAGNESNPVCPVEFNGCTLTPAFQSNQIAQRNLQIGQTCDFNISNTSPNPANLVLGINVTPPTPAPGSNGGPVISLAFTDPTSAFFNSINAQNGTGVTVSQGGTGSATVTTVTLDTSYIALNAVPLPAGTSPQVTINIRPAGGAALPSVNISSLIVDPMTGTIIQENGGTCQSTTTILH
jgi:hypothetical protein